MVRFTGSYCVFTEMNFWKYLYMDGTIEARYENVDNEMIIRASTELAGTDLSGDYNEYANEWTEYIGQANDELAISIGIVRVDIDDGTLGDKILDSISFE